MILILTLIYQYQYHKDSLHHYKVIGNISIINTSFNININITHVSIIHAVIMVIITIIIKRRLGIGEPIYILMTLLIQHYNDIIFTTIILLINKKIIMFKCVTPGEEKKRGKMSAAAISYFQNLCSGFALSPTIQIQIRILLMFTNIFLISCFCSF